MEREQAYYSLIAFGVAVLCAAFALLFSILFEKRMRMHARQNITNVLTNECKLELRELRKEVEQLKQRKLARLTVQKSADNVG